MGQWKTKLQIHGNNKTLAIGTTGTGSVGTLSYGSVGKLSYRLAITISHESLKQQVVD